MKLPHGLSPVWLSIPAIVFILIVGLIVARLPVFRAATTLNPEGEGKYSVKSSPLPISQNQLVEVKNQIENFWQIESGMQMPVIDRQISLPID